jgi:hypothetical protein
MTNSASITDSNSGGSIPHSDDRSLANPKTTSLATSSNDLLSGLNEGPAITMGDSTMGETTSRADGGIRKKLSKLLKGKEEEWTAVAQKKGPLQLLDLPMDVLKEIIKEV